MSSTSETGHARNIARFGNLINNVLGFGPAYNPSAIDLQTASLSNLHTQLNASLLAINNALNVYRNNVNSRQAAFEGMSKLSSRILSAVKASGATPAQIRDVVGLHKKVTGQRVIPISETEPVAKPQGGADPLPAESGNELSSKVKNSVSQLSYDLRIQNFTALVTFAASLPTYNPNEADLQPATLNAYIASLPNLSNDVSTASVALNTARIDRDKLLYLPIAGAVDVTLRIKDYVGSVFGLRSPEYRSIRHIRIIKLRSSITF